MNGPIETFQFARYADLGKLFHMEQGNRFGRLFKEVRTNAKKTLGDVARLLDCSISYVSDVEHGRRHPFENREIKKIAGLFNVDATQLLVEAAKSRNSVKITSDSGQVLEAAAGLARMLDEPENLEKVLQFLKDNGWNPRG